MGDVLQTGWTRVLTRTGRYEYQFQGRVPAVRNGRYEPAHDYQFLVMDETGWLYKIPVRLAADAEVEAGRNAPNRTVPDGQAALEGPLRIAAAQLRAGLENYRPQPNAPYAELDGYFAIGLERARELAAGGL